MELLAPAGNLEKLKFAVHYGADAVYFGTEFGSLRSFAGNFSFDNARDGLDYLHSYGKKGYVTLNIYPFSEELETIKHAAQTLDEMGADAFIVADMGVLYELRKLDLKAALHISTQANTTNYQAVLAYGEYGARRVNLARELSLDRIKQIQQKTNGIVETEVFIHGSVCFSYSGRCAISDYMTGFAANRGGCKHPCRWQYALVEKTRPGHYMPVFEDERGLYLFNSKDLALFPFVHDLAEAGVSSIKIEGRMKSIHYLATVISLYRQVLDGKRLNLDEGLSYLNRVHNRGYSFGFMKGGITPEDYSFEKSGTEATSIFVGNILEKKQDGSSILEVRNKIFAGESLEALSSDGTLSTVTMPQSLMTDEGDKVDFANNSQFVLLNDDLPPYTILRRVT